MIRSSLFATVPGAVVGCLVAIACGGSTSSPAPAQPGMDASPSRPDGSPTGSDASPAPKGGPPTNHVPTAAACPMTRPPGFDQPGADAGPGFACDDDSQCTDGGTNGRCLLYSGGQVRGSACTYDTCFSNTDCKSMGGGPCVCGVAATGTTTSGQQVNEGRTANTCAAGNCQVDSDCATGYCSPTYDTTCGPRDGYVGYYCHTPNDECDNDSDCTMPPSGPGSASGYCTYQTTVGKWTCVYLGVCSG